MALEQVLTELFEIALLESASAKDDALILADNV